jgi:hypothetical protein
MVGADKWPVLRNSTAAGLWNIGFRAESFFEQNRVQLFAFR